MSIKIISAYYALIKKKKDKNMKEKDKYKYKIQNMLWDRKQNNVVNAVILTCMKMVYVFIATINYI